MDSPGWIVTSLVKVNVYVNEAELSSKRKTAQVHRQTSPGCSIPTSPDDPAFEPCCIKSFADIASVTGRSIVPEMALD